MKELPVISVITITRDLIKNGRKETILQCINSVQEQELENVTLEHLIFDGCSTDGTYELLLREEKKHNNIKLISEKDSGIYDAMNKAVSYSNGDFIIFLNSDDYLSDKKALSELYELIQSKNIDAAFAYFRILRGSELSPIKTSEPGLFFLRMPFCHQTLLLRKIIFDKLGGFNSQQYRSAGDFDFVLRLFMSGASIGELRKPIVVFRAGGFSANAQLSDEEVIRSISVNLETDKYNINPKEMFEYFLFPEALFMSLQQKVDPTVLHFMNEALHTFKNIGGTMRYEGIASSPYFNDIEFSSSTLEKKEDLISILRRNKVVKKVYNTLKNNKLTYPIIKILKNGIINKNKKIESELELIGFEDVSIDGKHAGFWITGGKSFLQFNSVEQSVNLKIRMRPFLSGKLKLQNLKITHSDKIVYEESFEECVERDINLRLETHLGKELIEFQTKDASSPFELGISDDRRKLSFFVSVIEICPNSP